MMATISGGAKLEAYLTNLAKGLSSASRLDVGFFEGVTYPNGTSVAMIAAIQNFGAPSRGIPPRPFFTNMVEGHKDEWGPKLAALLEHNDNDAAKSLGQLGDEISADLKDSIVATNSPPLKPATIARKGFDKPLVDTGQMLNSVGSRVA